MVSWFGQIHGLVLVLAELQQVCADTEDQAGSAGELWLCKPVIQRGVRRDWRIV